LKYLTTVLDTVLDIDNYLRTSPMDRTPRARIAERCTSLLRYIAAYGVEEKRPYSKVIIVAHSLGSMVTADLLRYLERSGVDSPDPSLARYGFRQKAIPADEPKQEKLPIYVFSMGSPLRQLLNRFFPHLYWWVSDIPDNSLASLGAPVDRSRLAIVSTLPRTDEMNVTCWSNAYRSGDYVGRSLWVGEWLIRNATGDTTKLPDFAQADAPRSCIEMCIGLGAHTHYWDRTAPDVADLLEELIASSKKPHM
jgi:pimeloyl-ACP methyl ester carboxylesterase